MRGFRLTTIALAMLLLTSGAFADETDCKLGRYAALPITFDEAGGVTVPMKIAGEDQNLLVDTGGVFSMLKESVAEKLKLRRQMMFMQWVTMFGGRKLDRFVEAPLEIAGQTVPHRPFVLIPDDVLPSGDDGILAPDILAIFDLEFDFAASKLSLFSQRHCEGKVVYWTKGDFGTVPFKLDEGRHVKVTVTLDGKEVKAFLDTGSSRSVMSLETAADLFGFDKAAVEKGQAQHAFKTLSFGSVTVTNPAVILVPDDKSKVMGGYQEPELLVGMGVLRQLHLWIAFKEHTIYVTPATAQ